VIRFDKVTKVYPRSGTALRELNLKIAKGEFVFLTGPSGAGKSTILKLLYMDELPTTGEVKVSGYASKHIRRREVAKLRRRLGIVFQDFRLLEDRTAEQNVAFALHVTGTPRSSIPGKVSRALTQVGLAGKMAAYPKELSGGEQQRVAIARALVNDPFVLIADEPTGNLDAEYARAILDLFASFNQVGVTVLLSTHDVAALEPLGCRRVTLAHGAVAA